VPSFNNPQKEVFDLSRRRRRRRRRRRNVGLYLLHSKKHNSAVFNFVHSISLW